MHICSAFSCSMHTGRVTEYVKVLANMFLETLCMYVCMYTHTQNTCMRACARTHTHTHVVWFFVNFGKLQYGSLPVFMHWLQLFFLFQFHCIWYWMYGIIINVADLV